MTGALCVQREQMSRYCIALASDIYFVIHRKRDAYKKIKNEALFGES